MIIFLDFKETCTIFQFYLKEKIVHGKVEHMQIAPLILNNNVKIKDLKRGKKRKTLRFLPSFISYQEDAQHSTVANISTQLNDLNHFLLSYI